MSASNISLNMIGRLLKPLDAIAMGVAMILMATIAIIVFGQVVARYLFESSMDAVLELPKISFIVVIFIAMPLAYRDGMHIGIDLISKFIPPRHMPTLKRFNCVVMLVTVAMIIFFSGSMAVSTWDQYLPSIRFPIGAFYAAIVLGSLHLMLHIVASFITGNFNQAATMDD